ncbi:MAG: nucleotide sugar dehydrogenase, partial [Burkholderiales bacterium]|nr:nucleotide sugar dehydrogenase [Burkholderiales bacterium]
MDGFKTIGVIGLGYVGLPLAIAFGKVRKVIGFDMATAKIDSYRKGIDPTGEVDPADMRAAVHLEYTNDGARLAEADVIIVAVPTPVDEAHNPDFTPLVGASQTAGRHMKRGTTIVFESTVYPGATEEVCVPVIEKH